MATESLEIKWQPEPLQVDGAAAEGLVIKDPLRIVAKAVGFYELTEEQPA